MCQARFLIGSANGDQVELAMPGVAITDEAYELAIAAGGICGCAAPTGLLPAGDTAAPPDGGQARRISSARDPSRLVVMLAACLR